MSDDMNSSIEPKRRGQRFVIGDGEVTKERILVAACDMAAELGVENIRRDAIAIRARVAMGCVSNYFINMGRLREAVMQRAVLTERLDLIAMGLANGDLLAIKAPKELKIRALRTLM